MSAIDKWGGVDEEFHSFSITEKTQIYISDVIALQKNLFLQIVTKNDFQDFTYVLCGRINVSNYYIYTGFVIVSLTTSPNSKIHYTGFKLEYNEIGT